MRGAPVVIRDAVVEDAARMLAIYAPLVADTIISFELTPPSLDEFAARLRKYADGWAWLVAAAGDDLLGYAYASPYRERAAYRWSVEVSAYVDPDARRRGLGRRLYEALFQRLAEAGFCNAYAGIALPNVASVALHERVGFRHIGTFPSVGFKFGAWHDVAWFHLRLRDGMP